MVSGLWPLAAGLCPLVSGPWSLCLVPGRWWLVLDLDPYVTLQWKHNMFNSPASALPVSLDPVTIPPWVCWAVSLIPRTKRNADVFWSVKCGYVLWIYSHHTRTHPFFLSVCVFSYSAPPFYLRQIANNHPPWFRVLTYIVWIIFFKIPSEQLVLQIFRVQRICVYYFYIHLHCRNITNILIYSLRRRLFFLIMFFFNFMFSYLVPFSKIKKKIPRFI